MRYYSKKHYSFEQREWCQKYERETTFEPVMGDYEAGNQTFEEAQEWNKQWLVDWAKETVSQL